MDSKERLNARLLKSVVTLALVCVAGYSYADSDTTEATGNKSVPALTVIKDCSSCAEFDDEIQGKLVAAYSAAAKVAGATISQTDTAELKISDFNKRSTSARLIGGFFAGKDWIKGDVTFKGATLLVEDTARSTMFGIETVAENVGKEAYEKLSAGLAPQTDTIKPN